MEEVYDDKERILLIIGAHRKDGNSRKVLEIIEDHPLRHKFEITPLFLMDYKIECCRSCYQCTENLGCVIDDDVKGIVDEMIIHKMIIYIPVIYAFSINSIFQMFLERSGYGYLRVMNRPLRNKLSTVVVVGRRYGHISVASQVIMNILLNEMILVGSGFLPLLYSEVISKSIEMDSEGINSLNIAIDRILEFNFKLKGDRYESIID